MSLNTNNPMALRYLLEETLYPFSVGEPSTNEGQTNEPVEEKISFSFLGEHQRGLLYLVTAPTVPFFSEQALDAFTKTNLALGYSLADIAVLNTATLDKKEDIQKELLAFFNPKKIVFAGASPQSLGFPLFPLNSIHPFEDISVLYTYSFEEMLTDVQKKKAFWQTLKLL